MVDDTEPRYRLVDSNGNIVGSVYNENGDTKIQDAANDQDRLIVRQGGPVEVAGSNLRLTTGQDIVDGEDDGRIEILSTQTNYNDNNARVALKASSSLENALQAYSNQPVRIRDKEAGNTAIEYSTSPSAQGTFSLDNADLFQPAGGFTGGRIQTREVTLDSNDATTYVDVIGSNRSSGILFIGAPNPGDAENVYAISSPGDFDSQSENQTNGGLITQLSNATADYELEVRLSNSTIQVRAGSTGPEGEPIHATYFSSRK